jgi:hypothetical protein
MTEIDLPLFKGREKTRAVITVAAEVTTLRLIAMGAPGARVDFPQRRKLVG